ncbi:MAG: nuclear transport factor 2 family protein [Alphaproteobacteria bacterium]|nr:nuclear transport factor 2 family protein [Alphaproteobacteria bacterium]
MKIKFFKTLGFLMAVLLTQFSFSQTYVSQLSDADIAKIKSEVLETRQNVVKNLKEGNTKMLDVLFTDNFVFYQGAQTQEDKITKQDYFKLIKEEKYLLHNVIHNESKAVVVNSNLALITGIVEVERTLHGKRTTEKKSFTDVYINVNGVWKSEMYEYHVIH